MTYLDGLECQLLHPLMEKQSTHDLFHRLRPEIKREITKLTDVLSTRNTRNEIENMALSIEDALRKNTRCKGQAPTRYRS